MPWVHLKRLMVSADRRRQRNWKFQAALRNMEIAQNMSLMFGGGAGASTLTTKGDLPATSASRNLDGSTKVTISEHRDAMDPEGPGHLEAEGDSDDFMFWVKLKAMGYPVTLIDNRLKLAKG